MTCGGAAKAKKAGKNGNVNGLAYFFEDLAEKNSSAAASLAGKLISSEPPPSTFGNGYTPPTFNILSVPANHFLTAEQAEKIKHGEPLFDKSDTDTMTTPEPFTPTPDIAERNNLVVLPQVEQQRLALLESRINNMSAEQRKVLEGLLEGMVDLPTSNDNDAA